MDWMILPLRRYADFSGRSRRKEYWMFFLFQFLIQIVLLALFIGFFIAGIDGFDIDGGSTNEMSPAFILLAVVAIIYFIFWVALLIPNLAVVVRRLHDQDIPGIVGILLYIATIILTFPGIVILILMCLEGNKGPNQYGEDPKLSENVKDVFN